MSTSSTTTGTGATARQRKWNIPLTYQPKIGPVIRGECTQTIRTGRKFSPGDLIRFYMWSFKPYRSPRITITEYMPLMNVFEIDIKPDGIVTYNFDGYADAIFEWASKDAARLAELDGIVPPTGDALRGVLVSKNGPIPGAGVEAQIVRWQPTGSTSPHKEE